MSLEDGISQMDQNFISDFFSLMSKLQPESAVSDEDIIKHLTDTTPRKTLTELVDELQPNLAEEERSKENQRDLETDNNNNNNNNREGPTIFLNTQANLHNLDPLPTKSVLRFGADDLELIRLHFNLGDGSLTNDNLYHYQQITNLIKRLVLHVPNLLPLMPQHFIPQRACLLLTMLMPLITSTAPSPRQDVVYNQIFDLQFALLGDLITILETFIQFDDVSPAIVQSGLTRPLVETFQSFVFREDELVLESVVEILIVLVRTKARYREKVIRSGVVKQIVKFLDDVNGLYQQDDSSVEENWNNCMDDENNNGLTINTQMQPPKDQIQDMINNTTKFILSLCYPMSVADSNTHSFTSPIFAHIVELILTITRPVQPSDKQLKAAAKIAVRAEKKRTPPPTIPPLLPQTIPIWESCIGLVPAIHQLLTIGLVTQDVNLISQLIEAVSWLTEVSKCENSNDIDREETITRLTDLVSFDLLTHTILTHLILKQAVPVPLGIIRAGSQNDNDIIKETSPLLLTNQSQFVDISLTDPLLQQLDRYRQSISFSINRIILNLAITEGILPNLISNTKFMQMFFITFSPHKFNPDIADQFIPLFVQLCLFSTPVGQQPRLGENSPLGPEEGTGHDGLITSLEPQIRMQLPLRIFSTHLTTLNAHFKSLSESSQLLLIEVVERIAINLYENRSELLDLLVSAGWLSTVLSLMSRPPGQIVQTEQLSQLLRLVALFLEVGQNRSDINISHRRGSVEDFATTDGAVLDLNDTNNQERYINPYISIIKSSPNPDVLYELTYHLDDHLRGLAKDVVEAFL